MAFVLVTGASGAIGRPVCDELERAGHRVRGFDRQHSARPNDFVTADLTDAAAVRRAVAGVDAVVHLAAVPDDGPFPDLVQANVLGLYHVLDAARRERVRRVVLASSVQVLGQRGAQQAQGSDRAPVNHYALTKLWAEEMGEMYARCFGLSVIAARIGWMVRDQGEAERLARCGRFESYISRGDVARFFERAVSAEEASFAVLYAIGAGGQAAFDLGAAASTIGYVPRDAWPAGFPG